MSTNSLEIFKQLFLKIPNDIKDIFSNASNFVEDKDRAIAEYLAIEYSELIWLIRVLHIKYDKQFELNSHRQQHIVDNIARSITLTVDETGTLDYGQKEQNNLVLNTLETHLLTLQDALLKDPQTQDDIISLEGSNPDMDLIYQNNTTFLDITPQLVHSPTNKKELNYNKQLSSSNARTDNNTNNAQLLNMSFSNQQTNNLDHATVTQNLDHIPISNANNAIDVAQIVDQ